MQRPEPRDEVEMLALMLLIRRFEERASQQYQAQKIGGFCHLYIGQEAVVAGAIAAIRFDDYIITAYRDHAHALARGTSANACMAELFGKDTGCSRGLGGSMHYFDKSATLSAKWWNQFAKIRIRHLSKSALIAIAAIPCPTPPVIERRINSKNIVSTIRLRGCARNSRAKEN